MTLSYYKNEWTPKEWRAIIDKAEELGCAMEWSRYGNILTIDSTSLETKLCADCGERYRAEWAEHIHKYIQEAARL
jgi:hypothetical protein